MRHEDEEELSVYVEAAYQNGWSRRVEGDTYYRPHNSPDGLSMYPQ